MDNQIINRPNCQIEGCNNIVIGLSPSKKWICGEHLMKLDSKLKEERKKYFELIEKEIV